MQHWIGVGFGVMEGIISDNGGEFSSEETREVTSLLNLEVCTTAANSPFQNGLCERIHSVTDNKGLFRFRMRNEILRRSEKIETRSKKHDFSDRNSPVT